MAYKKFRKRKAARVADLLKSRYQTDINISLLKEQDLCLDTDNDLDELEEAILEDGLLSPLSVVGPYPDGTYKIIEGARRKKAFQKIRNDSFLPCYVVGDHTTSDREAMRLALSANKVKRNNDNSINIQYAKMVYEDALDDRITESDMVSDLANKIGVCTRQARKYLNLVDKASPELIGRVSNGTLGISEAEIIANAVPEAEQSRIAEKYKSTAHGSRGLLLNAIKEGEHLDMGSLDKAVRTKQIKKQTDAAIKALKFLIEANAELDEIAPVLTMCKVLSSKY